MCRKLYFRFVFYAVRTDLRIMKKKGKKSSQSEWLSTSMSPAAYLCRRGSTDICSRAFAALGRAHTGSCHGQDCLHLRLSTHRPIRHAASSGHRPLSISAPYRCRIGTVISTILRRRHDPRTKRKTLRTSCRRSFRCWHLSIVPGRFQPSIVDTSELNCRVRDGNGCTLTVIDTNYLRLSPPISSRSSRGDTLRTE